jgi:uncharacterized LabA/DUF88 family protein
LNVSAFVDVHDLKTHLDRNAGRRLHIEWALFVHELRVAVSTLVVAGGKPRLENVHLYTRAGSHRAEEEIARQWVRSGSAEAAGLRVVLTEDPGTSSECHACDVAGTPRCTRCRGNVGRAPRRGLDSPLAADLLALARVGAYDGAILVSSDLGLTPVVEFLQAKGLRIIHAGFPPVAADLARACWASIDLGEHLSKFTVAASKRHGAGVPTAKGRADGSTAGAGAGGGAGGVTAP